MNPLMPHLRLVLGALMLGFIAGRPCGVLGSERTNLLGNLEMEDQFGRRQELSFPATNITVLTVADREGAAQVDEWVAALKARFSGRVELRGLAHLGGVPPFLREGIRRRFRAAHPGPVMLDWSGETFAHLGCRPREATLVVLGRDGGILARTAGAANAKAVTDFAAALEKVLSGAGVPLAGRPGS